MPAPDRPELNIPEGQRLLIIGYTEDGTFAIGCSEPLIEGIRKRYTPEQFSQMSDAIEIALKHFRRILHGGQQ